MAGVIWPIYPSPQYDFLFVGFFFLYFDSQATLFVSSAERNAMASQDGKNWLVAIWNIGKVFLVWGPLQIGSRRARQDMVWSTQLHTRHISPLGVAAAPLEERDMIPAINIAVCYCLSLGRLQSISATGSTISFIPAIEIHIILSCLCLSTQLDIIPFYYYYFHFESEATGVLYLLFTNLSSRIMTPASGKALLKRQAGFAILKI